MYHRATIPNRDGYKVRICLFAGEWVDDVVKVGPEGSHRLAKTPSALVLGWLPATEPTLINK